MPAGSVSMSGRTYSADDIVISWIGRETPAPRHLVPLLGQYRNLTIRIEREQDPAVWRPLAATHADIYDALLAAAEAKLRVSTAAEHQLRRIQRRQEARLTLSERVALALKGDPRAAEWGPMEAYVPHYQPKAGVRS